MFRRTMLSSPVTPTEEVLTMRCQDCGREITEGDHGHPCDACGSNWAVDEESWAALAANYAELERRYGKS